MTGRAAHRAALTAHIEKSGFCPLDHFTSELVKWLDPPRHGSQGGGRFMIELKELGFRCAARGQAAVSGPGSAASRRHDLRHARCERGRQEQPAEASCRPELFRSRAAAGAGFRAWRALARVSFRHLPAAGGNLRPAHHAGGSCAAGTRSFYPRFDQATYDKLLADFELPTDRKLSAYSYGQKKKFLLAFGIASNARLLIMDEPTNGLDIPGKNQFRRALIGHSRAGAQLPDLHSPGARPGRADRLGDGPRRRPDPAACHDGCAGRAAPSRARAASAPDDALYVEESLEGYRVVRENRSGVEGNLNLELLFGLATSASTRLRQVLAR